jgi:hypothetical protein
MRTSCFCWVALTELRSIPARRRLIEVDWYSAPQQATLGDVIAIGAAEPRLGRLSAAQQRTLFLVATGTTLAAYLALLLWDVFHYWWQNGYDAWSSARLYTDSIRLEHQIPSSAAGVAHNPPLFYAAAALIESHVSWVPVGTHRAVQLLSVASGFAIVLLTFLIARELFTDRRWVQLGSLLFVAGTPVLLRGALMYHPDPLATALTTGGIYVAIRASTRGWPMRSGIAAGVLLGLANLTRDWAFAGAVAVVGVCLLAWLGGRERRAMLFLCAFSLCFAVLLTPWYVRQAAHYGDPFAFNRPESTQWQSSGRKLAFFTALDLGPVFSNPYRPSGANNLLPVTYADWWGDYWRYFKDFRTPGETVVLPAKQRDPMIMQLVVGIVPTLLAVAGIAALAIQGVRRRTPGLLLLVGTAALTALAFVWFLWRFRMADGSNIKALYILNVAPAVAISAAWALDWIRRHSNRLVAGGLVLWLLVMAAYDVMYLTLG